MTLSGVQKKRTSDRAINVKSVVVIRNFEEKHVLWESIEVFDARIDSTFGNPMTITLT